MADLVSGHAAGKNLGLKRVSAFRQGQGHWFWSHGPVGLALFLLATSKWGSYLPLTKPPYITDIVLGVLVGRRLLVGPVDRSAQGEDGTLLRPAAVALIFWCVVELVRGPVSITALRDFAPYFYAVAVFLVVAPSERALPRISRWIDRAFIFHAAWISLAIAVPSFYNHLPLLAGQINVFGPRNDFDGAVCGLYAAYCLHRALSGRAVLLNAVLAGWNIVLMLYLKERAGLLAFIAEIAVVLWLSSRRRNTRGAARAKALIPILILCMPLLYLVGSQTPAYQRFVAAIHPFVPFVHASPAYSSDTATEKNRQKAWSRIIRWQDTSVPRETVGIGFGTDFMHASGADVLLLGGPAADVRSPHNYFVGTWARLGLVGLGIVSAIVLCGLWLAVLVKRRAVSLSDVDILALLVIVGIPAAASVGVILESPFGALPYFWALGHLRARAVGLRTARL